MNPERLLDVFRVLLDISSAQKFSDQIANAPDNGKTSIIHAFSLGQRSFLAFRKYHEGSENFCDYVLCKLQSSSVSSSTAIAAGAIAAGAGLGTTLGALGGPVGMAIGGTIGALGAIAGVWGTTGVNPEEEQKMEIAFKEQLISRKLARSVGSSVELME